jgi:site-specific DNA recombinase
MEGEQDGLRNQGNAVERSLRAAPSVAWWGRVSTDEQQNPTLSLPRQLHNSRAVLPPGSAIVAHFYDVESGRRELELRGRSTAHERFDIAIARNTRDDHRVVATPDRALSSRALSSCPQLARSTSRERAGSDGGVRHQ